MASESSSEAPLGDEWEERTDPAAARTAVVGDESRPQPYLVVVAGAGTGEMWKLAGDDVVIGRGSDAGVRLAGPGVSRHHARVRPGPVGPTIEDLGSTNGTFVNGRRIERHQLVDGDKVQLGETTVLRFAWHDELDETFQRQLLDSSLRDGLTRAFNQRHFTERLEAEFAFARRHSTSMALVLFDIDHFHLVNHRHGHAAGDQVLRALGEHVPRWIRKEDVLGRTGGDDFAIICRGVTVVGGAILAERVRRAVAEMRWDLAGQSVEVTVSAGVAGLPHAGIATHAELVTHAEVVLAEAKRTGRDRVAVEGPEDP